MPADDRTINTPTLPALQQYYDKTDCLSCGLWQTCRSPLMAGSGMDYKPDVMVVGEAPGREEDREGAPFMGESGDILRGALEHDGLFDMRKVRFTNAVRCRPPQNKLSEHPKAVTHCKGALLQEIEDVNPKLVILMGNTPMRAVLNKSGITSERGKAIVHEGRIYFLTVHPAATFYDASLVPTFVADITRAGKILRGEENVDGAKIPHEIVLDPDKAIEKIEALHYADSVAFDFETTGLDLHHPRFKLLALSFCPIVGGKIGKAFSIPLDHKKSTWTKDEIRRVKNAIRRLLRDEEVEKIGHNLKYDYQCAAMHLGVEPFGKLADTMLEHWCLNEKKGTHSLKRLAWDFTPFGGYDNELKKAKEEANGVWEDIDFMKLLSYNAKDSYVTAYLHLKFQPLLVAEQQENVVRILKRAVRSISRMEMDGIKRDELAAINLKEYYEERLEAIEEYLDGTDEVAEASARLLEKAIDANEERLLTLYNQLEKAETDEAELRADVSQRNKKGQRIYAKDLDRLVILKNKQERFTKSINNIKKEVREYSRFNFGSVDHLQVLLFDVMRLSTKNAKKTQTGYSTDEELLSKYKRQKIPRLILETRTLNKMLGTYIRPLLVDANVQPTKAVIKLDGLLHPNYLIHGTETGRLSCGSKEAGKGDGDVSNYPVQTLPRDKPRKMGIRGLFTSKHPGGKLISADYKQIELFVFGILAKDENILKAARESIDLHKQSASMIWSKPISEVLPEERQMAKSAVSFGLAYGRSAKALADQFGEPERWAVDLKRRFFAGFTGLRDYLVNCKEEAFEKGFVMSPFGRKRRIPEVHSSDRGRREHAYREAVNSPIQGAASDLTLTALCETSDALYGEPSARLVKAAEAGFISMELALGTKSMKSRVVGFVHDSIVIDAPPEEVTEASALVKWIMENREEAWVTCPTAADIKISDTLEE